MGHYRIRYVHRIRPSTSDGKLVELPDNAFSDQNTLVAALREQGLFYPGTRFREIRVGCESATLFPDRGVWHSISVQKAVFLCANVVCNNQISFGPDRPSS